MRVTLHAFQVSVAVEALPVFHADQVYQPAMLQVARRAGRRGWLLAFELMVGRCVAGTACLICSILPECPHFSYPVDKGGVTEFTMLGENRMRRREWSGAVDGAALCCRFRRYPNQRENQQADAQAQPPKAKWGETLEVVEVVSRSQRFCGASFSQWWRLSHNVPPLPRVCLPAQ